MNRYLCLIAMAFAAGLPSNVSAAPYTEIVAFGDSTTDMGNSAPIPEGMPLPTIYGLAPWIQQLAGPTMLNIPDLKPSGKTKFTGGTNYAFGGTTTQYGSDQGWHKQLASRNLTDQISKRYLGTFNTGGVKTGPETLHVVWMGLNDLHLAYSSKSMIASQWAGMNEVAKEVVKSVEGQIQALANAGVKNVLWMNATDLSKFPGVIGNNLAGGKGLPALSEACGAYNVEMDAAILRLKESAPGLNLIKGDVDQLFRNVMANPGAYDIKNVTTAGLSDDYLFFYDGMHPSPHAHYLIAKYVFDLVNKPTQP